MGVKHHRAMGRPDGDDGEVGLPVFYLSGILEEELRVGEEQFPQAPWVGEIGFDRSTVYLCRDLEAVGPAKKTGFYYRASGSPEGEVTRFKLLRVPHQSTCIPRPFL